MILIADCGSTKIDWCVLNNGKTEKQVFTVGMNAVMLTEEEMRGRFENELMPQLGELAEKISSVFFYGAGCISACGACAVRAQPRHRMHPRHWLQFMPLRWQKYRGKCIPAWFYPWR